MLVSYDHDFLFVHVPKTGGTSVRNALAPFASEPLNYWHNRGLKQTRLSTQTCYLEISSPIAIANMLRFRLPNAAFPKTFSTGLFKFSFVRNPWDLLVSNYSYILNHPGHKRYRRVNKLTFPEFIEFAAVKGVGFQKQAISDASGNLLVDRVGFFEKPEERF